MLPAAAKARLAPAPKSALARPSAASLRESGVQTEPQAAELSAVEGEGAVRFHVGPAMRSTLERRLRGAEGAVRAALYCFDDSEVVRILCQRARDGVSVKMVLDESQLRNPSCSNQLARMLELCEWGAELYRYKVGPGFMILHHKLWVIDGSTLLSGSVNPTHNGLTNNEEHLLEVNSQGAVVDALSHLESLFSRATFITAEFITEAMHVQEAKRRGSSLRR